MNGLKIIAHKEAWSNYVSIAAFFPRGEMGVSACAMPLTMVDKRECELVEPMVTIDPQAAQGLMDSLWDCGLRPSEGSGSAGALAATQRHLEDMRRLVFKSEGAKP